MTRPPHVNPMIIAATAPPTTSHRAGFTSAGSFILSAFQFSKRNGNFSFRYPTFAGLQPYLKFPFGDLPASETTHRSGGGHSSAISRRVSPNRFVGMATSAI